MTSTSKGTPERTETILGTSPYRCHYRSLWGSMSGGERQEGELARLGAVATLADILKPNFITVAPRTRSGRWPRR